MADGGPSVPTVEMNSNSSYASIWDADGTVHAAVVKDYRGADSDKSSITGITAGSTYFAWDSSKLYMYDGTTWNELFAGA